LFWKEYRTQRSLWLVLAICLVALQALIAFLLEPSAKDAWSTLPVFAVVIVCGFIAASVALLFAGEEDLGTSYWLRQFPVSTFTLFLSKVSASLFGIVTLSALAALSTFVVMALGPADLRVDRFVVASVGILCVAIFFVTLFWSLQCRGVFPALGWSTATMLLIALPALALGGPMQMIIIVVSGFALIVISIYPLAMRWHRGLRQSGTARSPRSARSRLLGAFQKTSATFRIAAILLAIPFCSALIAVLLAMDILSWPVIAVFVGTICLCMFVAGIRYILRALGFWSFWLTKAAERPTLLSRTSAVLCWQECRFAIPAMLLALSLGIVAVLFRLFVSHDSAWPMALLGCVVVEFGLRSFRHDQKNQNGLFWSHRGVSPLLVYSIRTSVWLGLLLVFAVVLLILDLPIGSSYSSNFHGRIIDVVNVFVHSPGHRYADPELAGHGDRLRQLSGSLAWLTGGFFIGQICSCWFRKPLIAMFLAAIAFGGFSAFTVYGTVIDLPPSLSLWPVVILLAAAMMLSRREWMDRRDSLRIICWRTAFVLIPLLCLWPVKAAWRMFQVPPNGYVPLISLDDVRYGPSTSHSKQSPALISALERLDIAASPLQSTRHATEPPTELEEERLTETMEVVDEILERLPRQPLPSKWRNPWTTFPAQALAFATIQKSQELHEQGDAAAATTQLLKGVRLLRYLQHESSSWDQWRWCIQLEHNLLQRVHDLAADDQLTAEQLQLACHDVELCLNTEPSPIPMLQNRSLAYDQVLYRYGPLWELYRELWKQNPLGPTNFPNKLIHSSFAERTRFNSLMAHSDEQTCTGMLVCTRQELARWASTTLLEGTDLEADPVFYDDLPNWQGTKIPEHLAPTRSLINAERATWVILQLQAYRREHGEFPRELDAMFEGRSPSENAATQSMLTDAENGTRFRYAPNGIKEDFFEGSVYSRILVPAQQPLLWSSRSSPHGNTLSAYNRLDGTSGKSTLQRQLNYSSLYELSLNPNRIVWCDGGNYASIVGDLQPEPEIPRTDLNSDSDDVFMEMGLEAEILVPSDTTNLPQ